MVNLLQLNSDSGEKVSSFTGKKGLVNVEFKIDIAGTYLIIKDNVVAVGLEVTDSLKTANLEDIRKKLINE